MADFFLCLPSCACVRRKVCAGVFVPVCVVRSWWMDVLVKSLSHTWLSDWAGTDCSRWQRQAGDWKSYSRSALLHVGGGEPRRGKRIWKFGGRERRGVSSVSPLKTSACSGHLERFTISSTHSCILVDNKGRATETPPVVKFSDVPSNDVKQNNKDKPPAAVVLI